MTSAYGKYKFVLFTLQIFQFLDQLKRYL